MFVANSCVGRPAKNADKGSVGGAEVRLGRIGRADSLIRPAPGPSSRRSSALQHQKSEQFYLRIQLKDEKPSKTLHSCGPFLYRPHRSAAYTLFPYFHIDRLSVCWARLRLPVGHSGRRTNQARDQGAQSETVDVPSSRGRGVPVLASLCLAPRNDAAGQDAAEQTAREQQLVDAGGVVHDDHGHGEGLRTPLQRRGEGRAQ